MENTRKEEALAGEGVADGGWEESDYGWAAVEQ